MCDTAKPIDLAFWVSSLYNIVQLLCTHGPYNTRNIAACCGSKPREGRVRLLR